MLHIREFLFIIAAVIACVSGRSTQTGLDMDPRSADLEDDLVMMCRVPGCHYDLQLFCLNNGVIVMGSCSLKNTLCTNGIRNSLQIADGWDTCFDATYSVQQGHIDPQMVMVHSSRPQSAEDTNAVPAEQEDEVVETKDGKYSLTGSKDLASKQTMVSSGEGQQKQDIYDVPVPPPAMDKAEKDKAAIMEIEKELEGMYSAGKGGKQGNAYSQKLGNGKSKL